MNLFNWRLLEQINWIDCRILGLDSLSAVSRQSKRGLMDKNNACTLKMDFNLYVSDWEVWTADQREDGKRGGENWSHTLLSDFN